MKNNRDTVYLRAHTKLYSNIGVHYGSMCRGLLNWILICRHEDKFEMSRSTSYVPIATNLGQRVDDACEVRICSTVDANDEFPCVQHNRSQD
jgi:hypothetical protein